MSRVFFCVALVVLGCRHQEPEAPYYTARSVGVEVPRLAGWSRDLQAESTEADKGGVALRLVRDQAIAGSPRLDVTVTPKDARALSLDEFLEQNLQEMRTLEASGSLHLTSADQSQIQIGPRRAFRVRHTYALGGDVAITQSAVLLVLDGRGVAITVVGRTELYHPLANAIEAMLTGIRTTTTLTQEAPSPKPLVEPIDLGKVGGTPK